MAVFQVPRYRKILSVRAPWHPASTEDPGYGPCDYKFQRLIPKEPLHEILGIEQGSRVLFFAGGAGDWAHRLAQTTNVHYTDISKKMVDYARERFEGKGIRRFSTVDAVRWPASRSYDYLVSFEPLPLRTRLPLILVRALAHTKGLRVVELDWMHEKLKKIIRLYGARGQESEHELFCADKWKGKVSDPSLQPTRSKSHVVSVFTVDSNETARKRAKIDLAVIMALQDKKQRPFRWLKRQLAKKGIAVGTGKLKESLNRIHEISQQMLFHDIEERSVGVFG